MKLPPPLRRAGSASADGVFMAMTPSAGAAVGGGAAGAGTAGAGASGSSGVGVAADGAARVASAAARVASEVAGAALGAAANSVSARREDGRKVKAGTPVHRSGAMCAWRLHAGEHTEFRR